MIQRQKTDSSKLTTLQNFEVATNANILKNIHQAHVNISIYERDTSCLRSEIDNLLNENIEFRSSGAIDVILDEISKHIDASQYSLMIQDITECLYHFKEITKAKSFRLLLASVNTNMCRKFHTDINNLRMLSTYKGPGTLWLTDENINVKALNDYSDNESIAIDEAKIQQAKTGAVLVLKGALYPQEEVKAIVHRSPTIEESGEKRLLLRIDTNDFLNFL